MTRPRRAQLSRATRRVWLLVHVVVSVGWLGAGAANLALMASRPPEGSFFIGYQGAHIIDAWVVIPAAFGTLFSGIILAVGTKWGLFRHWWVSTKLILTIAVITFSTFGLGLWIELALFRGPRGAPPKVAVVAGMIGNLVALLLMTGLSIYKPKGTITWRMPRRGSTSHGASHRRRE